MPKKPAKLILWDSKRILGIDRIDREHKQLAGILNNLYDYIICPEANCHIQIKIMLEKLYLHSKEHFVSEEKIMQTVLYPGFKLHKQEHYYLLVELKDYIREFNLGELKLTERTLCQLKNWYLVHIHTSDKSFADFYHKSDISPNNRVVCKLPDYIISKF